MSAAKSLSRIPLYRSDSKIMDSKFVSSIIGLVCIGILVDVQSESAVSDLQVAFRSALGRLERGS